MASVYCTAQDVYDLIGEDLTTDLIDLDEDGGDDTATLTAAIADVGYEIDSIVERKFDVPFAQVTDTPATPAIIRLQAKRLVAARLLRAPLGLKAEAKTYEDLAMPVLEGIRDGKRGIPGVTPKDADEQATTGFAYVEDDGAEPVFAGTDSDGDDRMAGW